jgi:hypothetical protein
MAAPSLDYAKLFAKDLPIGPQPWGGFPPYNFVGGHKAISGKDLRKSAKIT